MAETKDYTNGDQIDLRRLLYYLWKGLQKFCLVGLLLVLAISVGSYAYSKATYEPRYEVSASLIVTDSMATDQTFSELTMAAQMGKTFSYIVKSDLLRNVVANDLGLDEIEADITATAVQGTNLLTISVRDSEPQRALDTLNSVLDNYPTIADYVLGPTKIDMIQEGTLPTVPFNEDAARNSFFNGILAGMALYFSMALIYALTIKTAGSADDIRESTGVEFLTAIPRVTEKRRSKKNSNGQRLLVSHKSVNQSVVEGFLNLANRLEQDSENAQSMRKIYMVTSATTGEGKTTVATNLAYILARRKKRVLLVDADLREASASTMLGVNRLEHTLQSLFKKASTLDQTVQRYRRTSLYVLPVEKTTDGAEVLKILSDGQFRSLLKFVAKKFDYVIVDTPPYGLLADAATVAPFCDGVVFVARQDYARLGDIEEAIERVAESGTPILGFVMNGSEGNSGNYGYGYGYGYGYRYGYNYGYGTQDYKNYYSGAEKTSDHEDRSAI